LHFNKKEDGHMLSAEQIFKQVMMLYHKNKMDFDDYSYYLDTYNEGAGLYLIPVINRVQKRINPVYQKMIELMTSIQEKHPLSKTILEEIQTWKKTEENILEESGEDEDDDDYEDENENLLPILFIPKYLFAQAYSEFIEEQKRRHHEFKLLRGFLERGPSIIKFFLANPDKDKIELTKNMLLHQGADDCIADTIVPHLLSELQKEVERQDKNKAMEMRQVLHSGVYLARKSLFAKEQVLSKKPSAPSISFSRK
jgi:hypothetical protein